MHAITKIFFVATLLSCNQRLQAQPIQSLKVSENGHFLQKSDGEPFFWMGETGWLLFGKLTREEANTYLDKRKLQGFNVIQVMVLHSLEFKNVYGDSALHHFDPAHPKITPGADFNDAAQYDFWDHVDYVIKLAEQKGLYMALVPIWGSAAQLGITAEQATAYATFLAERYKNQPNIIWLDGGDISGATVTEVWKAIGETLKAKDGNHLVSYHPRGRMQSSKWFHRESWLDFNTFQSGHRNYAQDTSAGDLNYGEDNWRYVQTDYVLLPTKPTIDAEPSYEGIPQGLHDTTKPYWKAPDVRRYGYWSVFAGAAGYTYGSNAVMQMHKPTDNGSSFGAKEYWDEAINSPGANQMIYLKKLMLSKPYFERVPDQSIVEKDEGEKYDRLLATRGTNYAFIYTYTGRNMSITMGKIKGAKVKASWYDPRTGKYTELGTFPNKGITAFDPPGEPEPGNDWVLVLETN